MNRSDVINDGNDNLERNNLNSLNYWQIINFMHFLDDSSIRDGQSINLDGSEEDGPPSSFQSTFFLFLLCF